MPRHGGGRHSRPSRGNGFATAAVALGAAGASVVTLVPAVWCGVLGLRRARDHGPGLVRSWLGIGMSVLWVAAGLYLVPHLVRASDPGCAAYKGPALTAYDRVIADLSSTHGGASITPDLSRAISELRAAAARSHDARTSRALSALTAQLREVLGDIRDGNTVPNAALGALNRDASRADSSCGTLHL
jgi:hypothetical protein